MSKQKGFFHKLINPLLPNSRAGKEDDLDRIVAQEHKLFRFETLVAATNNFQPSQKLGEGAFGPVFKGRLDDGREVAVKRLAPGSNQGKKEFKTEAKLLARVQHKNVVNLLGYCVNGAENLLVYEYVVNESLDKHLFKAERREVFDWKRRYDVIRGIAKGLLYLHEQAHCHILHRDIKASNILLDEKWVPKIADFGMARLFTDDQTHLNTHVAGTNGYLAPEYLMHGHLSTKADVFSFGVVVLEIVSGERNSAFSGNLDYKNLLDWAYRLYKKRQASEIMDSALVSSSEPEQVTMCIQLGLLCVQSDPESRPDMNRVLMILSRKPTTLEEPARPGFPGSRFRRHRASTTTTSGSSSGTSGSSSRTSGSSSGTSGSGSRTSGASTSGSGSGTITRNTMQTSITDYTSHRSDPHGKRPMRY